MGFLLDTNIVSELRKRKPHGAVLNWIRKAPEQSLHLSAVTLGEIQAGIELTRELDITKAQEIEAWLDDLAATGHVIAADAPIFRRWAKLMHRRPDHHLEDALIAATAIVHDMTLVTRNVCDFAESGVKLINPWAES